MQLSPTALRTNRFASSGNRGILADTLNVSGLIMFSKVAGAAKAVVIAAVFGSSTELDAYLIAFLIPSFLADVFCASLVPALVPAMTGASSHDISTINRLHARMQRICLRYSIAGGLLLAMIAAIVTQMPTASPHIRLIGYMVAILSPMLPLAAVANLWRALLHSQRRFVVPTATAVMIPLVIISTVLVMGDTHGIWVLAWATTTALLAEVVILAGAVRRTGFELLPKLDRNFALSGITPQYRHLVAAAAASMGGMLVGQSLAATLGGGQVSILNYGTRLTALLVSVGPAALAVTILPRFSSLAAGASERGLNRSLRQMLVLAGLASSGLALVLILFSPQIVHLTLEHGAFTAEDTAAVSTVQRVSLIQLPFAAGATLLVRALAALETTQSLVSVTAVALLGNAILAYALVVPYGVVGITIAATVSQAVLCAALAWVVYRAVGRRLPLENYS